MPNETDTVLHVERFPSDLHRLLKARAAQEGQTLRDFIVEALTKRLQQQRGKDELRQYKADWKKQKHVPVTSCPHKSEDTRISAGQYNCPYCGAVCVAGQPHPDDDQVREQGLTPFLKGERR